MSGNLALSFAVLALTGCRVVAEQKLYEPDAGKFDTSMDAAVFVPLDEDTASEQQNTTDTDSGTETDFIPKVLEHDPPGAGALCPQGTTDLFVNRFSPSFGGEQAVDIEVVLFANFACPHCASLAEQTKETWKRRTDFANRARFFFHHFPFDTRESWDAHAGAVAAARQSTSAFWKMHDYIFEQLEGAQKLCTTEELKNFARDELKLDMVAYSDALKDEATYSFLQWDKAQGEAQGVSGTPTLFVCGQKITSSQLEATVAQYLGTKP